METLANGDLNEMDKLLSAMVDANASDLHLKVGSKPLFRIAGAIRDVGQKVLSDEEV